MALHTALTRKLGIEHPILLAPMGGASGGKLAAAVSGAGGLGMIGGAYGDREVVEREFAAAGNVRVGCGFITWALARRPEALDQAISHAPLAIMLSFGDAAPFLGKIRAAGIVGICQVQSLRQAREVLDQGADIIVAQGTEAGGHGAVRATLPLVPAVVDAVARAGHDVPVVAAGGIADGCGLAAVLMLGAEGVLMGTRFYASDESLAHPAAKARVVAGSGDDTFRTTVFDQAATARNAVRPLSDASVDGLLAAIGRFDTSARDCSARVKPAGRNDSCGRARTIADMEPVDRVAILSGNRVDFLAGVLGGTNLGRPDWRVCSQGRKFPTAVACPAAHQEGSASL
jgi:nitronate monooxygenase